MRGSLVVSELKISFEEFIEYGKILDMDFSDPKIDISEETFEEIKALHSDDIRRKEVQKLLLQKKLIRTGAYFKDDSYKMLGVIKWFGNKTTGGEYGFIEVPGLGDVFFHYKSVVDVKKKDLSDNTVVVLRISKADFEQETNKRSAIQVYLPNQEEDLFYIFSVYLSIYKSDFSKFKNRSKGPEDILHDFQKIILIKKKKISNQERDYLVGLYLNYILDGHLSVHINIFGVDLIERLYDKNYHCSFENKVDEVTRKVLEEYKLSRLSGSLVYSLRHFANLETDSLLREVLLEKIDKPEQFNLWRKFDLDIPLNDFQNELKGYLVKEPKKAQTALEKVSVEQKQEILNHVLQRLIPGGNKKLITEFLGTMESLEVGVDLHSLDPEAVYWLWKHCEVTVPFYEVKDQIALGLLHNSSLFQEILSPRLTENEVDETLEKAFEKLVHNGKDFSIDAFADFIKLLERAEKQFDLTQLGSDKLFELWDADLLNFFPVDAIRSRIKYFLKKEAEQDYKDDLVPFTPVPTLDFLQKIELKQFKDLFSAIFYQEGKIESNEKFEEVVFILEKVKPAAWKKELAEYVYSYSTDFYKLQLFTLDFTDEIEYDGAVIYTGLLSSEKQKLFFKKLIKLIAEDKIDLSLKDLNRITTIDYQLSEHSKEIDGVGLDYTLSIIIQLLNDLDQGLITKQKTIYDLVAQQVKKPDDLLVIDGFFDKCNGRTILKPVEKNTDAHEGPHYTLERSLAKSPRFSTFCDGRKALVKDTGEPSKCQKSGREFWWCENAQCYDISRKKHQTEDYKHYSLADVLRVLNIPYQEEQYEKLLAVINRVNRFLSHMTCRSCNSILRPANGSNNSNYAFYRVTRFHCDNPECSEKNLQIYLSHCLNGQCMDIIDSRHSVKCKPKGFVEDDEDNTCGWYICNNCFACCSTEKIDGRKKIMTMTGQDYCCHDQGHKDLGKICCNKCGNEMEQKEQFGDLYQKQLNWFIENQEKGHPNIANAGRRKDGKWWFLWSRGKYDHSRYRRQLENMYYAGFNIPEFHFEENDIQLVAEPYKTDNGSKIFRCANCENVLKINDFEEFDYARQRSIYYYHDRIFPRTRVTT